jgi:hypothetical protein
MTKMGEFFQNDAGALSMTRLLMFLSWPPATIVMFHIQTVDAMAWYLAAYVGGYAGGKFAEKSNKLS